MLYYFYKFFYKLSLGTYQVAVGTGLAFRPIVFLGFWTITQKPTTQATSTFGSIFMRHPKTIDRRERNPIIRIKITEYSTDDLSLPGN